MVFLSFSAWQHYRVKARPRKVSALAIQRLSMALVLYGLIWGVIFTTLIVATKEANLIILVIAVGLCSTAVTMSYYLPLAVLTFSFLCLTPVIAALIYYDPSLAVIAGPLYLVYLSTMMHAVSASFRVLIGNLHLRVENEKLLKIDQQVSVSKNKFIASMSRELRTPLNAISGYAQLIKLNSDQNDTAKLHRSMDNILDASSH